MFDFYSSRIQLYSVSFIALHEDVQCEERHEEAVHDAYSLLHKGRCLEGKCWGMSHGRDRTLHVGHEGEMPTQYLLAAVHVTGSYAVASHAETGDMQEKAEKGRRGEWYFLFPVYISEVLLFVTYLA
jgi:hypothetical protein